MKRFFQRLLGIAPAPVYQITVTAVDSGLVLVKMDVDLFAYATTLEGPLQVAGFAVGIKRF